MQVLRYLALCGALFYTLVAQEAQVLIQSSQVSGIKGDSKIFSGDVSITPLFEKTPFQAFSGGLVEFSKNARSAWHIHPAGQTLIVLSGTIISQVESGEVFIAKKGDVIICPPNVRHWHGATNTQSGSHIAITSYKDSKNVVWLDKVSDEEYKSALKKAQSR